MSDIVERLRAMQHEFCEAIEVRALTDAGHETLGEAAAEIERRRAEVERLRAALGFDTKHDAGHNLTGVLADTEPCGRGFDAVCRRTVARVHEQIEAARAALEQPR